MKTTEYERTNEGSQVRVVLRKVRDGVETVFGECGAGALGKFYAVIRMERTTCEGVLIGFSRQTLYAGYDFRKANCVYDGHPNDCGCGRE